MQQATTAKPPNESAPDAAARHASLRNRFVINLCGSTTPSSLAPPDHAGLKRFTFFVSRRREEGRERFRLHMGYFDSQEEAERLLDIVREIYPAAWAGLAPGQRLAQAEADAAAAAAANAAASESTAAAAPAAAMPQPAAAPAASPVAAAPPAAAPIAAVVAAENSTPAAAADAPAADTATTIIQRPDEVSEPTINQPVAVAAPDVVAQAEVAAAAALQPSADDTATPPDGAMELPALSLVPDEGRRIHALRARKDDDDAATRALSNVRAAIASLGDTTTAPTVSPLPELKPAARAPAVPTTAAAATTDARDLSDTAALRVLEHRDSTSDTTVNQPRLPAADASPTGKNEKPAFAVQLLWSVQPIDITQIPQLAIFSAYTLYGAEGNRDGRRWYGVRLGFFTDAVSAKQVAHYVRSDFSTVSVVPVTARERERAKLAAARPEATPVPAAPPAAAAAAVAKPAAAASFDFIEDKQPPQVQTAAAGATPAARSPRGAPGKRAKNRAGRQGNSRARPKAMTLEETLEILGAGELKMDEGRRASINDGLAKLPAADATKDKPSRIGRLLERLSGIGS